MKKLILALILTAGCLLPAAAQSAWRGQAGVITDGSLPESGYFAASNEFPRNTLVTVENLKTKAVIKVRILKRSPEVMDANFIFLNNRAASDLGLQAGESGLVSVQIDTGLEGIRSSLMEDNPTNPDPETNLAAGTLTDTPAAEPAAPAPALTAAPAAAPLAASPATNLATAAPPAAAPEAVKAPDKTVAPQNVPNLGPVAPTPTAVAARTEFNPNAKIPEAVPGKDPVPPAKDTAAAAPATAAVTPPAPSKPALTSPGLTLAPEGYNPNAAADTLAGRAGDKRVHLPPRESDSFAGKTASLAGAPVTSTPTKPTPVATATVAPDKMVPAAGPEAELTAGAPLAGHPAKVGQLLPVKAPAAAVAPDTQVAAGEGEPELLEDPLYAIAAAKAPDKPAVPAPDAVAAADEQVPAGVGEPEMIDVPLTGNLAMAAPKEPEIPAAEAVLAPDVEVAAGEGEPEMLDVPLTGNLAMTAPKAPEAPAAEALLAPDTEVAAGEIAEGPTLVEAPLSAHPAAAAKPQSLAGVPTANRAPDTEVPAADLYEVPAPIASAVVTNPEAAKTTRPTKPVVSAVPVTPPVAIKPAAAVVATTPAKPAVTVKPAPGSRRSINIITGFQPGVDYVHVAAFKDEASLFKALDTVRSPVPLSLVMSENAKAPFRLVAGPLARDQVGILVMDYRSQGFRLADVIKGR